MKATFVYREIVLSLLVAAAGAIPLRAQADISLFDYGFNQDGVVTLAPAPPPPGSGFDTGTGLGLVRMTFSSGGFHSALLFVDHELSEAANTFFNELGSVSVGSPSAGLSWEIDEPGFVSGDIFDNFVAGNLDNSIGTADPDDVSMALGWQFILGAGEVGIVDFLLSETPPSGFHLRQFDPDSGENVYFSSALTVESAMVPEGHTLLSGLLALALSFGTACHRLRR